MVIAGLPVNNYAEAAAVSTSNDGNPESSAVTESAVLQLVNTKLNVPLMPHDISFVHRLKSKPHERAPPNVIVRFSSSHMVRVLFCFVCIAESVHYNST